MSRIDAYVEDVMNRIPRALPQRDRIEADLLSHLANVVDDGRSEGEAIRHMGPPEEVARGYLSEISLDWAPLGRRTLAFVLDMCLGLALAILVAGAWFAVIGTGLAVGSELGMFDGLMSSWRWAEGIEAVNEWADVVAPLVMTAVGLTLAVASFLYFPVLEYVYGQTAGKWLLGIAVTSESGERVGFGAAVVRRLPLLFNFFWLDAVFAPFTEKRQRAFDMVADTVVVDVRDAPPPD